MNGGPRILDGERVAVYEISFIFAPARGPEVSGGADITFQRAGALVESADGTAQT